MPNRDAGQHAERHDGEPAAPLRRQADDGGGKDADGQRHAGGNVVEADQRRRQGIGCAERRRTPVPDQCGRLRRRPGSRCGRGDRRDDVSDM
jgi:hypothetical protein